jgi:hypothetical protein
MPIPAVQSQVACGKGSDAEIERLGVPGSPLKIGEGGSASQILWKLLHKSFCSVRN